MSKLSLTIEHKGKTLYGHIALIKSTFFGWEDHGILTAQLNLEWPGSGISAGGYRLDTSDGWESVGTAYGLDHLIQVMKVVGVNRWEDLPHKRVIVLFENEMSLGSSAVGLANIDSGKVFLFKEHAAEWRESEED